MIINILYFQCLFVSSWSKSNYTSHSPNPVTCSTVTPTALHLSKTCDAALFPAETTAGTVNEIYTGLWVYCEVQEETHHLSVCQNIGLGRTWTEDDNNQRQGSHSEDVWVRLHI